MTLGEFARILGKPRGAGENMRENIAGKVVVITGANSGHGESTAHHLVKERATVVLGACRRERIDALAKDILFRMEVLLKGHHTPSQSANSHFPLN